MNNLSSYCGLTNSRMRASEKDLPVQSVGCEKLVVKQNFDFRFKPDSQRINNGGQIRSSNFILKT